MNYCPSPLYTTKHPDALARIDAAIARGCGRAERRPRLFFRADDIGVPSAHFARMIDLFQRHHLPLCLATVPSWLTARRWQDLQRITTAESTQWYWHQHGRSHHNFEPQGKKQEFGPSRSRLAIRQSLQLGRDRLQRLQGELFHPVFTPPWNRCSAETLTALADLGYQAVSRSRGALPQAPAGLFDLAVNVDLHTRKEPSAPAGFAALLSELEEALASGTAGIMLHHQRMNRAAFALLDLLLDRVNRNGRPLAVHFGDLLAELPAEPLAH
ncbi:MAG TPA: polysaccharide deacetylase family protein [Desulforhopalus sp.]|nr:polysaccharide deacetylase family protein [Desulforhopalus sp.]